MKDWIRSLIACSFFLTYSQIGIAGSHGLGDNADVTTHFQSDEAEAESLWTRVGNGNLSAADAGNSCSVFGQVDSNGNAIALYLDSSLDGNHHTKLTIPASMLPLRNGRTASEAQYGASLVERWSYRDGKLTYTADTPNGPNHRSHVSITLYANPGLTQINGFDYKSESQSADWNGNYSSKKGFWGGMGDLAANTPFISAFMGSPPVEYAPVSWSCRGNLQAKRSSR